jgi:hypothetical protein
MGTAVLASHTLVSNSTVRLAPGWNAFYYWGVWAICIIGVGVVLWAALRSKRWARWTTQDILIVAALGVLLEVYDNIIGDQLISPLINPIPGADFSQIHDLPYMFLLIVGVALVRKAGCVTAMVFINYLLAQLLFGSGHGALDWTDGLTQGIFCDLYIVARGGRVFGTAATRVSMVVDSFVIGVLRGGPNAFLTDWTFDPYLNATYYTWLGMWQDTWPNGLFNGIEAAVSAVLAHRVAVSVVPSLGASRRKSAAAADPFAEPEPADGHAAAPGGVALAAGDGGAALVTPESRTPDGGLA